MLDCQRPMLILASRTTPGWAERALADPAALLADHRSLEHKAAVTAEALARKLAHAVPALTGAMRDLADGRELKRVRRSHAMACYAVLPDGRRVVTGNLDGSLSLWDMGEDTPPVDVKTVKPVWRLALSPDGKSFTIDATGTNAEGRQVHNTTVFDKQ